MDPFSQTTITTDFGPMVVHRGGQAGPWVVGWPALMGDHRSMKHFGTALLGRHRVLLFDPPGFGANCALKVWPSVPEQASMAHSILDAMGITHCHWVGQGFGAQMGAAMVARLDYKLLSLTLASVPLVQPARINMLRRMVASLLYQSEWGRRAVSRGLASQMTDAPGPERERTFKIMVETQRDANPAVLRQLGPTPANVLQRLLEQARKVRIPMLVIAGAHDRMVLPRDQRTLAEVLQAQYVELDAGPMVFATQPAHCVDAFLSFVKANPRPAAS